MERLLLVEDTASLAMLYGAVLSRAGHPVTHVSTLAEARAACAGGLPRLMLLDLQLPDGDGLELLAALSHTKCRVIVITANGSINRAVQAMRAGAFDFLVKPFDETRLLAAVENALAAGGPGAIEEPADAEGFEGFIGASPAMREIYRMVRAIGRSTATVFITGESGTGKEVCARAIHAVSNRAKNPFVPLNCAAIPRDLLESEVFGHLRGAFTGALSDKPGAAAVADGGTLFLDEICEMDLSLQTKLLRFLQTSTIQPVGAARPVQVDARIVCATNRDPAAEVSAGRFREDLYYRLHVVPIHMPPLRARPEDVLEIARASLATFAREEGRGFVGFAPEAERALVARPWPGNVRQLLNVIRNVVVLHDGRLVQPEMLPAEIAPAREPRAVDEAKIATLSPTPMPPPARGTGLRDLVEPLIGRPLADVEREFIEATIAACDGSIPRAARILELSPSTIYRKLESWGQGQRRA